MTNTIARIKKSGKKFEVIVNLEQAIKVKKEGEKFIEAEGDKIFTDSKKGERASPNDLKEIFGTEDTNQIALKIVREGEVQLTQDYRDEEKEKRIKRVVDFLSRNAIDPQMNKPLTQERIKSALEESRINIKNVPIENQISEIVEELNKIIPIKIQTKKVKAIIPSMYTGQVYGLVNQYKEKENWLNNGDLEIFLKVPSGLIMDFYDKLNNTTHGSAITEEIRE